MEKRTLFVIIYALLVVGVLGLLFSGFFDNEQEITYTETTIQQKYVLCEYWPEYFILCDGDLKYQITKYEYASVNVGDRMLVRSSGPYFEIVQVY